MVVVEDPTELHTSDTRYAVQDSGGGLVGPYATREQAEQDVSLPPDERVVELRTPQSRLIAADGVIWEPWTDGWAVGFKVTREADQAVRYVYLNPSSDSDDGTPSVFLYDGDTGEPYNDGPVVWVNPYAEEAPS